MKAFQLKLTSNFLQDVADACRTGAATNIIFGLALGYKSAIIPCFVIAIAIYISFSLANMFGIACAALGMLTTLATGTALPSKSRITATSTAVISQIFGSNTLYSTLPISITHLCTASITTPGGEVLCLQGLQSMRTVRFQTMLAV